MQFSKFVVIAALAGAVSAASNATYVTATVTSLTTVCPAATTLTYNGATYTATASQTITITNCPCTISYLPTVTPVVYCNTCAAPTPAFVNSTVVVPATVKSSPVGSSASPTSSKPAFTGAATKAVTGSAASLAGFLGIAAFFL